MCVCLRMVSFEPNRIVWSVAECVKWFSYCNWIHDVYSIVGELKTSISQRSRTHIHRIASIVITVSSEQNGNVWHLTALFAHFSIAFRCQHLDMDTVLTFQGACMAYFITFDWKWVHFVDDKMEFRLHYNFINWYFIVWWKKKLWEVCNFRDF